MARKMRPCPRAHTNQSWVHLLRDRLSAGPPKVRSCARPSRDPPTAPLSMAVSHLSQPFSIEESLKATFPSARPCPEIQTCTLTHHKRSACRRVDIFPAGWAPRADSGQGRRRRRRARRVRGGVRGGVNGTCVRGVRGGDGGVHVCGCCCLCPKEPSERHSMRPDLAPRTHADPHRNARRSTHTHKRFRLKGNATV